MVSLISLVKDINGGLHVRGMCVCLHACLENYRGVYTVIKVATN